MSTATDLMVPLRPCTPWCEDPDDSHGDEHPEDRRCWSDYRIVPLGHHKPARYTDGSWLMAYLNVYLVRPAGADETLVLIHSEETDKELRLTLDEARTLRDHLSSLIDTAENVAGGDTVEPSDVLDGKQVAECAAAGERVMFRHGRMVPVASVEDQS